MLSTAAVRWALISDCLALTARANVHITNHHFIGQQFTHRDTGDPS